jgi:dihydrofolate reductase/thymidylate synthase
VESFLTESICKMKIARFNIILLMDMNGGISKDGAPPTSLASWTKYMKEKTIGKKNNAVIMGRKTYELICPPGSSVQFLPHRENYVISSRYDQKDHNNIVVYKSLIQCLSGIANRGYKKYDDIWVIGGEKLFNECVKNFLPYCNRIVVCKLHNECYDCDQFFPMKYLKQKNIEGRIEQQSKDFQILVYHPAVVHQENAYLSLLLNILENGRKVVVGETEFKTLSNQFLYFDISDEFPLLTTRHIDYKEIIDELMDDIENLDFTSDSIGFRIRCKHKKFSGTKSYIPTDNDEDQLDAIIPSLTKNSTFTIYLSFEDDDKFIPMCIKFNVSSSKTHLNATVCCNKMEMFKHFPFYLCYVSLLMSILAYVLGTSPKDLYFFFCDASIQSDYVDFVKKICSNDPKPFPVLAFKNISSIKNLFEIKKENIEIKKYDSWVKLNFDKTRK